jgi:hypothetical protein
MEDFESLSEKLARVTNECELLREENSRLRELLKNQPTSRTEGRLPDFQTRASNQRPNRRRRLRSYEGCCRGSGPSRNRTIDCGKDIALSRAFSRARGCFRCQMGVWRKSRLLSG